MLIRSFGPGNYKESILGPVNHKNSDSKAKDDNSFGSLTQKPSGDVFQSSNTSDSVNNRMTDTIPNSRLKLELKLEQTRKQLDSIDREIETIKNFGLDRDKEKLAVLEEKRRQFAETHENLKSEYRELKWIYKVTDFLSNTYKKISENIKRGTSAFENNDIVVSFKSAIPALKERQEIKKTIEKMSIINNSLSGVFSRNTNPFVDQETKNNQFIALMTEAHKLDFKTTRFMGTLSEKNAGLKEFFVNGYRKILNALKEIDLFNGLFKAAEK